MILFVSFDALFAYKTEWHTVGACGGISSSGTGFIEVVGMAGQTAVGKSTETSTFSGLYAGYGAGYLEVESSAIYFYDPLPLSSTENTDADVTCEITIETYTNNIATATVRYRISSSGPSPSSFSNWYTGAIKDEVYSAKKIRYSVTIPTSATGVAFSAGDNNYIQWRCYDSGALDENSSMYRIKIKQPSIEIVQPVDFAGRNPVFQANITGGGIVPSTVVLDIDLVSGGDVISITGAANYNSSTGEYKKRWTGADFREGEKYRLIASVRDAAGNTYTDTSEFVINAGMVADLIPVPSPFNPLSEGVVIRYVLNEDAKVSVSIYNTAGELVMVLVEGESRSAGLNEQDIWYARDFSDRMLANGIYFCEIVAETSQGEQRRYSSLAVLKR
ncbi:MAG: hypothetical protein ABIH89_08640 [Elusimicrobiota bacterium]